MDPEYLYTPSYTFGSSANSATVTYFNFFKDVLGDSYVAEAETPRVFCSFGPTPAAALTAMATLLKKEGIETWSASAVSFDEEGTHYLTIYL